MNRKLLKALVVVTTIGAIGGVATVIKNHKRTTQEQAFKAPAEPMSDPSEGLRNPASTVFPDTRTTTDELGSIVLNKNNTLVFRTNFNVVSVANLQKQLIDMDNKLGHSKTPIYLVLDTPGGDVTAGGQLIDTTKALHREVKTITIFSASMGFFTAENLGERLITPSGVLMAHRARIENLGGQVPGEALTRLRFILSQVEDLEKRAAQRIGVSHSSYQQAIRDEYWVTGNTAVRQNLADRVVTITCDDSMAGTYKERLDLGFVQIDLMYSECPAVTGFLGYQMVGEVEPEAVKRAEALLNNREYLVRHVNKLGE